MEGDTEEKSQVDTALIESQQPAQNGDATNDTDSEYALITRIQPVSRMFCNCR